MKHHNFGWHCVTDYAHIIPEDPGVYAIYILNYVKKESRLIYIGMAVNLEKRLKKHEIRKVLNALLEYPEIPYIKVKVIQDYRKRFETERWLIDRLQPKANYV